MESEAQHILKTKHVFFKWFMEQITKKPSIRYCTSFFSDSVNELRPTIWLLHLIQISQLTNISENESAFCLQIQIHPPDVPLTEICVCNQLARLRLENRMLQIPL